MLDTVFCVTLECWESYHKLSTKFLEKHKLDYWADGGTLLGIFIDNHIIPWDDDVEGYFDEEIGDGHNRATLLKLGALLHDVAKPATKTIEPDGRIRFFGHQHQVRP